MTPGYTDYEVRLIEEIVRVGKEKDNAYSERNKLVAALSKVFPSWLETHPAEDKKWSKDWRTIVFIHSPVGQLSWHLHFSEAEMFSHLEHREGNSWDGHTTKEKYERLASLSVLQGEEG